MIERRKVCMLGATGVGKTSLVARFVRSIFSETYRTTIGVTIDKKRVLWEGREVDLILWDLSGEDEFQGVSRSYMRGAGGYLLVIDGTRRATVDTALGLHRVAFEILGGVPRIAVLNKSDLAAAWEIDRASEAGLRGVGCSIVLTSAKTGAGVEEAFSALAREMMMSAPGRAARGA
jgi:small GTP-binding protein